MTLSPEARAQVASFEAAKLERARRGAIVRDDPRATLGGIGPGWWIESTTRRALESSLPLGGVVVVVAPGGIDADTGEIAPTRYRVLDPGRAGHEWNTLDADEVSPRLRGLDRMAATNGAHWLLRQVPPTRRVMRPADAEHIHAAWVLAVSAAGL